MDRQELTAPGSHHVTLGGDQVLKGSLLLLQGCHIPVRLQTGLVLQAVHLQGQTGMLRLVDLDK